MALWCSFLLQTSISTQRRHCSRQSAPSRPPVGAAAAPARTSGLTPPWRCALRRKTAAKKAYNGGVIHPSHGGGRNNEKEWRRNDVFERAPVPPFSWRRDENDALRRENERVPSSIFFVTVGRKRCASALKWILCLASPRPEKVKAALSVATFFSNP